jgi:ferrous iron transport protein A
VTADTIDEIETVRPTSLLGDAPRGLRGRIHAIEVREAMSGLSQDELESRLIELGFVEGAEVEVLHEGLFGHDPIAVRVNHATIALRRKEAMAIVIVSQAAHQESAA